MTKRGRPPADPKMLRRTPVNLNLTQSEAAILHEAHEVSGRTKAEILRDGGIPLAREIVKERSHDN